MTAYNFNESELEQAELMCGNEVEHETEYPEKSHHGLPLAADGKGAW